MSAEHWEMAQRENWLGSPDVGHDGTVYPFAPLVYCRNDSMVTTNASLELDWCRTKCDLLQAAAGVEIPERPAILWQVSAVFVFNGNVSPTSRWLRYQQAMDPFVVRDALGNRMAYPKYAGPPGQPYVPEPGWALWPSMPTWEQMAEFWIEEFHQQLVRADYAPPCGIFIDSASTLIRGKWRLMFPGITDPELSILAAEFNAGRSWLFRRLREEFSEALVLVVNWAKDKWTKPSSSPVGVDNMTWLNGLTFEGNPLFSEHRNWARSQWWKNWRRGRKTYGCLWNAYPSLLPLPPLFDYMARHGSHWAERHGG